MRLAARTTVITGALAIVLIIAQAAPARFDQSEAPSGTTQTQPDDPRPPGTPPILRRAHASELPAIRRAQARQARALSYSPSATAHHSNADTDAYATAARPAALTTPTVGTSSNGFDYGDAAIGAGITAAIALLITAGTLTVRQRRQLHHP